MKAEAFSAWLSGIAGLSLAQRREALQALARADGGEARSGPERCSQASPSEAAKRGGREDGLGSAGHERVDSQGCPHCAGRAILAWGRSHRLSRFRCKSCGRTFNALTKTPMVRLRKKERWLDHARAMIEGKSLAKTAELCGVHPTTAFRWRHRFLGSPAADKPRTLSGIVEADETFILESFKGRWSDLPRKARKRGGNGQASGPPPGQYSHPRRPRPDGRDLRRRPAAGRQRRDRNGARRRRHAEQPSGRRRREGDRRLRAQGQDPLSRRACARQSRPPRRLTCTSITSTPITAA